MISNKQDICIVAPAKLNLNLRIIRKDFDGYHFIKSHVCFLKLCDYIYISKSKRLQKYQRANSRRSEILVLEGSLSAVSKPIFVTK